jgi:hypothetical protein
MRIIFGKQGIELQVNFIVTFILSVAVFILGLWVLNYIFVSLPKHPTEPPVIPPPGYKVYVPDSSRELKIGESLNALVMIKNHGVDSESFRIAVSCGSAQAYDETLICDESSGAVCEDFCGDWFLNDLLEVITIPVHESKHIPFVFSADRHDAIGADTRPGRYSFDIIVSYLDQDSVWKEYDTTKKFMIKAQK